LDWCERDDVAAVPGENRGWQGNLAALTHRTTATYETNIFNSNRAGTISPGGGERKRQSLGGAVAFCLAESRVGNESAFMTANEATAEVFVTAFKALKPKVRDAVLQKLVEDSELREDLADTLVLEARRGQPAEPLRDILKGLKIRA
jgi:hypothetical protein